MLKSNGGRLFGWLLLVVLFVCSGCYTKKQAMDKFCKQDSATARGVIYVPVVKEVPPDTVRFVLEIDALQKTVDLLKDLYRRQSDSLIILYSDSLHEVSVRTDINNGVPSSKWSIRDKKPRVDSFIVRVPYEVKVPCNCVECTVSFWDNWQYFIYGALIGMVIFAAVIILRR